MSLKVMITGGLGNVGQWAVKECVLKGYDVYVYEIENERTLKKFKDTDEDIMVF